MSLYKNLLILGVPCLLAQSALSAEKIFGVYPRTVIPPPLAANVAENVFVPGALNLRFGMTREEAVKMCPHLEYDGAFAVKYFLGFTHPVILQNQVKGIEFSGGFPKPSRETVSATVEWLLAVFGTPDIAFDKKTETGSQFGLIWKRTDFAVACWFSSAESGKSFYAFLKLVSQTSNMDRILSARGGHELTKSPQSILASLKVWSMNVAQLEPKASSPRSPVLPPAGPPAISIESLGKYEVLSGEGLSGSGFIIQHRGRLYGVCSLHQFDGKTPGSLEPIHGATVQLDKPKAIRQKDAQAIPVRSSQDGLAFLRYNSDFTLPAREEVFVLGPSGGVELGMIIATGAATSDYRSSQGPQELTVRMAKPFTAAGGSGCPVIQKSTGTVVGVLLSANSATKASIVTFETLCLPR